MKKKENSDRDTLSQVSQDSTDSNVLIAASDIRKRLADSLSDHKIVKHDPEDPSAAALKVSLLRCCCCRCLVCYIIKVLTVIRY